MSRSYNPVEMDYPMPHGQSPTTYFPWEFSSQYMPASGDYMQGITTGYENSCILITSNPGEYPIQPYPQEPMSPYSVETPGTPGSASYSPPAETEPYYGSSPNASQVSTQGTAGNVCPYSECTSKGRFKRKTDLNRHIKTQHEADRHMQDCHHGWCGRTGTHGFSRLDHLREHLREVHREQIPYKTTRKSSKKGAKRGASTSEPRPVPSPVRR